MKSIIILSLFLFAPLIQAGLPEVKKGEPLPSDLFIELAKVANPAVVNISTTQLPKHRSFSQNDPYSLFLRQFLGPQYRDMQAQPTQSLGTGFIIRKDGLILTNNHVIDKADIIKVQLRENDDNLYEAEVIGKDDRTDIALIKIKAKNDLPTIKLGNSSSLEVGEWVAAFGNPYGHGHTMTKGIISAKGRDISALNKFSFIQTDASINPGNSGGPLVNVKGEVVGVNTAIDARAQGIGFAIPINDVKEILPALEKSGHIKRGFVGVNIANLNEQAAKSLNLKSTEGALVTQVLEKGPAAKAGIKPYDVIKVFNNKPLESADELVRVIQDSTVGKSYPVVIEREGKTLNLKIKIEEHPQEGMASQDSQPTKKYKPINAPYNLGFSTIDYNQKVAKDWDLPLLKEARPIIIDVEPDSPAGLAGLAAGDIILDVNKRTISRASQLKGLLKKGQVNFMRILRGQGVALVQLRPNS